MLLADRRREILFGGAAGGGKSISLLMAASQFLDFSDYAALVLRRTYADLALPGALMDVSHEWWDGTDAKWNGIEHAWTFPSGASLSFGYLSTERDKYRYQSSAFQCICFDELTQFEESQYTYLFSRLRKARTSPIPLRMRAGTNPGGCGHEWVKERFIEPWRGGYLSAERLFVPSLLSDNPHLDIEAYRQSLSDLDPATRRQLEDGDWDVVLGSMFDRSWFSVVESVPVDAQFVRSWDKAATSKGGDWSVGLLLAKTPDGMYYVADVVRGQWSSGERDKVMLQTAAIDRERYGIGVVTVIEQEPGSSGVDSVKSSIKMLDGYTVKAIKPTGSKEVRAQPVASQVESGNYRLVRGHWNKAFLDELTAFPLGEHDDQVDALSQAHSDLSLRRKQLHFSFGGVTI